MERHKQIVKKFIIAIGVEMQLLNAKISPLTALLLLLMLPQLWPSALQLVAAKLMAPNVVKMQQQHPHLINFAVLIPL